MPELVDESEKAKAADDASQRLRDAGFPETAITSWWMLLIDPKIQKTAHRVWESGDFATLSGLVDKTVRHKTQYRAAIEQVTSERLADRLAQRPDIQNRLLGALP